MIPTKTSVFRIGLHNDYNSNTYLFLNGIKMLLRTGIKYD
jgi:hypothetical protein